VATDVQTRDVQTTQEPNLTTLVTGIISDVQRLVRQEVTLARTEVQQEFTLAKQAVVNFAAGGVVTFLGVIVLMFGLVHLLHWATGGPDSAAVPLWAWFLIVGAVIAFLGGALLFQGVHKASQVQVPPPQTTDSLKEIL
jgi:hypothetical protein